MIIKISKNMTVDINITNKNTSIVMESLSLGFDQAGSNVMNSISMIQIVVGGLKLLVKG